MSGGLAVHPVTAARWHDMEALFEAKGSPHYCWCVPYRFADAHTFDKAQRKEAMQGLIQAGTPVGVLAYQGGEPVGWCSVAPRPTYAKLERSRTMPLAEMDAASTWAVLCFFVARPGRGGGVALRLLEGGVAYAKANGALAVEGYPWDTMGISSTHRGHSSWFHAAGFRKEEKRWVKRFH
ncbi:MAG TPA: GNAT family N-acetyltransferase [Candidatus Thermoplasmatota archaeon]|nr:GNAT family N-acetyltransferase [Candidatus Thermoplasmatota archaeon]